MTRYISGLAMAVLGTVWVASSVPAWSADLGDGAAVPHVNASGIAGYQAFTAAEPHRAFAIAPGGTWAWVSGRTSTEAAEAEALNACRQDTEQPCQLYATDDQMVFDEASWVASWNLHFNAEQVSAAPLGTGRGNRFPDIALTAPDGRAVTLSDLKGKPVFLHFWGSWCPPCQAEFADLQKLHDALADDNAVAFVLVQGREPIAKSRRWATKRGFTMPLYDSGHQAQGAASFLMADGSQLSDRRLATVYPTTYVLDANGLVVFHRAGPELLWAQYESLLRRIAVPVKP